MHRIYLPIIILLMVLQGICYPWEQIVSDSNISTMITTEVTQVSYYAVQGKGVFSLDGDTLFSTETDSAMRQVNDLYTYHIDWGMDNLVASTPKGVFQLHPSTDLTNWQLIEETKELDIIKTVVQEKDNNPLFYMLTTDRELYSLESGQLEKVSFADSLFPSNATVEILDMSYSHLTGFHYETEHLLLISAQTEDSTYFYTRTLPLGEMGNLTAHTTIERTSENKIKAFTGNASSNTLLSVNNKLYLGEKSILLFDSTEIIQSFRDRDRVFYAMQPERYYYWSKLFHVFTIATTKGGYVFKGDFLLNCSDTLNISDLQEGYDYEYVAAPSYSAVNGAIHMDEYSRHCVITDNGIEQFMCDYATAVTASPVLQHAKPLSTSIQPEKVTLIFPVTSRGVCTVIDLKGAIIHSQEFTHAKGIEFSTKAIAKGVYLLSVESDLGSFTQKIRL